MSVLAHVQCRTVLLAFCLTLFLLVAGKIACAQADFDVHFEKAIEARLDGRYERSAKLYTEAIAELDTTTHIEELAQAYRECGRVYEALGNFSAAMENYRQALNYFTKSNDLVGQSRVLNAFGYFYELQFDHNYALEYYKKALQKAKLSGDIDAITEAMTSIGSIKASNDADPSEGHAYLDSVITLKIESNHLNDLSIVYNEKAKAYAFAKEFEKGLKYYHLSYAIDLRENNVAGQVISENNLASALLFSGQHDSALYYSSMALEKAKRLKLIDDQRFSFRIQAYCHKDMGNYDQAFATFEDYVAMSDSVFFAQNMTSAKRLQAEYDSDLKDQEIESLHQKALIAGYQQEAVSLQSEVRKKWIVFIVIFAILILVISVSMFLRAQTRQRNKMLRKELEASEQKRKVEDELRLSQIKAIKAQMNPHFMFNVLASVQHFVMNNDTKNALLQLDNFSALMRSILHQSEAHWISLKDELQLLQSYTELEALRFAEGIEYSTVVELPTDEDGIPLDADDVMIPSLLIQPLVENAVKHGLSHKSGARRIIVEIEPRTHSLLHISISDNGIGRAASSKISEKENSGISLGMNGVQKRLSNVYKNTNTSKSEELRIEDLIDGQQQACGTRVSFVIPFVQEDQVHRQKELIV